jgi:hypothetical protein
MREASLVVAHQPAFASGETAPFNLSPEPFVVLYGARQKDAAHSCFQSLWNRRAISLTIFRCRITIPSSRRSSSSSRRRL